ncbi:MAG: hypothetical protein IKG92_05160 [Bacteroidales bacterium]|nr:hypothetical protein [Bacteroidales bacterium]
MSKSVIRVLILSLLALSFSCKKETEIPVPAPEVQTVHYRATVQTAVDTRATVGDDLKYEFEEGDRVYMESTGEDSGKMYGFLSLSVDGGIGKNVALFEGDLICVGGFTPTPETPVKLILVGPEDKLHSFDQEIIAEVTADSYINKWAASLKEAVRQLSHFTVSGVFGASYFTLQQQSSFLVMSLSFNQETVSAGTDVTANLVNDYDDSHSSLGEVTCQTVEVDGDIESTWVFAFTPGTELSGAKLEVEVGNENVPALKVADATLQANTYYTFQRATYLMDYFAVEATVASTSVTFNYAAASNGIQYSRDGFEWLNYSSSIPLSEVGDKVYFRGKATSFKNTGSNPLLSTGNKACYVYGDIMFLMCDEKYKPRTAIPTEYAFQGAFKNCTWLRLKEDHKLKLSASTLAKGCYKAMFMGCTGLTKLPYDLLPAMAVEEEAYYQMFKDCSALTTPPTTLPATTLKDKCYYQMFQNCKALTSAPSFPGEKGTISGTQNCFQMFDECTSLKTANGKLFTADTQLTDECFHGLFRHCYALNNVPEDFLPSLHMAKWCYRGLFEGAAFTEGPKLPATELVDECYRFLFNSCKNLNTIRCNAANPNNGSYTTNWVGGGVPTSSGFTFYKNSTTTVNSGTDETKWPRGASGIPNNWEVENYTE